MDAIATTHPAPWFWMERVRRKRLTGEYPTEEVSCFCGSLDGTEVCQQDRYGQEHRMVVCHRCGLIYANPRMTAAAYAQFYQEEYRKIYVDTEEQDDLSRQNGQVIYQYCLDHDHRPKTVVDIGCNNGLTLEAFREEGCTVYGVDLDASRVAQGGPELFLGTPETLIAQGVKADLVILHHVFEHCLDLRQMMNHIRALLAPNGLVWIGVPGIRAFRLDELFQNAHTYQFSAPTLIYVMECGGFDYLFCSDQINSLWRYTGRCRSLDSVDSTAADDNLDCLGRDPTRIPEVRTYNKFPLTQRKANIQAMLASGRPDLGVLRHSELGHEAIIVAGGPSVDGQVAQIRRLQESGARLLSIERMVDWCRKRDLLPEYVVVIDASPDTLDSLSAPSPKSVHLVASQCLPETLTALSGVPTYLFHIPQTGIDYAPLWAEANVHQASLINSGGSVALCALGLAMQLGMRRLHLFGFDCHITGSTYATDITGVGPQPQRMDVTIGDRDFITTPAYLAFAQQFFQLVKLGVDCQVLDTVTVYGDSLVSAMNRAMPGVQVQ